MAMLANPPVHVGDFIDLNPHGKLPTDISFSDNSTFTHYMLLFLDVTIKRENKLS
jgi:hypothetical protein